MESCTSFTTDITALLNNSFTEVGPEEFDAVAGKGMILPSYSKEKMPGQFMDQRCQELDWVVSKEISYQ